MPDSFQFDEAGLRDLLDSRQGPVAKELLRRTIRVEGGAKRRAPVDTGRLRSSITHSLEEDAQGLVGIVGTDVEYARRIEFGFSGADSKGRTYAQPAQPYLRPALADEMTKGLT